MNCSHVRSLLPLALYGDVPANEAKAIEAHLAECLACRRERQALEGVQRSLDLVPAGPAEAVRLPQLYAALHRRSQRRARRWRWAALFALATAAGLAFLALSMRLEMRVEQHQLVVRWGTVPAEPPPALPTERETDVLPPGEAGDLRAGPDMAEQVALLSQIVRTLVRDGQNQEQQRKDEIARLQARLDDLQRRTDHRLTDAEKDLRTLYKAQFVLREKGAGL